MQTYKLQRLGLAKLSMLQGRLRCTYILLAALNKKATETSFFYFLINIIVQKNCDLFFLIKHFARGFFVEFVQQCQDITENHAALVLPFKSLSVSCSLMY